MDTNKELYNHILLEFMLHQGRIPLDEARGYVVDANRFIQEFMPEVEKQIATTILQNGNIVHTYEGTFDGGFFKEYKITITTSRSNSRYNGSFSPFESFSDEGGHITCLPVISITCGGPNAIVLQRNIAFSIGHELTHAYNTFKYAEMYGLKAMKRNILYGQGYKNIKEYGEGYYPQIVNAASSVLYHLNRMERNAYIAQLKQELAVEYDWIKDSRTAMEAIKASRSYEKFLWLEKQINAIMNLKDEKTISLFLNATNGIIRDNGKKPFSNFEQLKKYYAGVWREWKKKYLTAASKIAYDVYAENNLEMDGELMDKKPSLEA